LAKFFFALTNSAKQHISMKLITKDHIFEENITQRYPIPLTPKQ